MRPLTDDETKVLFEKLANYIGKNIEQLINRPDEKCCFRLHKDRVYYVRYGFPSLPFLARTTTGLAVLYKAFGVGCLPSTPLDTIWTQHGRCVQYSYE